MTRELAGLIMAAIAAAILLTMFFAWRARLRRDSGLTAPLGFPSTPRSRHGTRCCTWRRRSTVSLWSAPRCDRSHTALAESSR